MSLAGAQVLSQVIGFISVVYLARIINAGGFGRLNFAMAILSYFALLIDLGLDTLGTREIARSTNEMDRYVNNILGIRLIASIFAFILLAVFVYVIPKPPEVKKLIFLFGLSLFVSAFLIEWVFQGTQQMEFIAISHLLKQIAYVGMIFLFVKSPEHLLKIPIINLASTFLVTAFLFFIYSKHFNPVKPCFDLVFWKEILKQSLPMGFSFIMIRIYYNLDSVMLSFMKNDEIVGWYSAAYKIILAILTVGGFYYTAIFPIMSNLYKTSIEQLKKLLEVSLSLIILIIVPLLLIVMLSAKHFIIFIYGPQYAKSVVIFQILLCSIVIIFISSIFGWCLLGCNRQKYYMASVTVGAVTNIILNFLLIPRFEMVGAAVATVIAELAVFVMVYHGSKSIVSISFGNIFSLSLILQSSEALLGTVLRRKCTNENA